MSVNQYQQWVQQAENLREELKAKVMKMQNTDSLSHRIFIAATICPFQDIELQLWSLHDHLADSLWKHKSKTDDVTLLDAVE